MDIKVFDRIEKKYLITKEQKNRIMQDIADKMQKDKYFTSEIFNIYFDNDNFDLIIQSIDRPPFKEKVRARSYAGYDKVFLEIKTKIKGKEANLGYKRRIMITKSDYRKFIKKDKTASELARRELEERTDLQIAKEIDYLFNYFDLKPKVLLYYDRESYVGEDNLRITFDENLRYRTKNIKFQSFKHDQDYFKNEKNIIREIKASGVMPLWLVKLLSKEKVFPSQFSKIGKVYEQIRKEQNV